MMLAYNIYRIDEMAKRCSNELRSMEFDRKKKSCRSVNALSVDARRLWSAVVYVANPESAAARIREAAEKVKVLLLYKEVGQVDLIRWNADREPCLCSRVALLAT